MQLLQKHLILEIEPRDFLTILSRFSPFQLHFLTNFFLVKNVSYKWAFSDALEGVASKKLFCGARPKNPIFNIIVMKRLFSNMRFNQPAKIRDMQDSPTLNWTPTSTFIIQLPRGLQLPTNQAKVREFHT